MVKTIMKEAFIMLLITVAVLVVLALVLYQFMPTNRVIPSKVTVYATPEEVAKEIDDEVTEQEYESTNTVYDITDSDLSKYKSEKNYNPGKVNPFAEAGNETLTEGNNSNQNIDRNTTDNYYTAANVNSGTK